MKALPKPRPQSVTAVFTNRQRSAPSVPRPSQSFGYEEDGRGKLVLQDGPSVIYSGTKNDRIAPNHYFENNVGGAAKVGTIGFGLSKTRREKCLRLLETKRLAWSIYPHKFDRGQR